MNQKNFFYQSHCFNASNIHSQMAELQRKAGRDDLAKESEKIAQARRVSARDWSENYTIAENMEWGENVVKNVNFLV